MLVGTFEFYLLVGTLMAVGALAGLYGHFARGHVDIGETAETHRIDYRAVDRLMQRTPLRADIDANGGWDIMSRWNMASMAVAGAAGPFVAGLAVLSLLPR